MAILQKNIRFLFCLLLLNAAALQADFVKVSGILEPLRDADVSTSTTGKIDTIHYREGQYVQENTVVIQLNDTLERLEVDRYQVIFDNKAELEAAVARMKTIKVDLDSTRALFEKTGSVSQEELDKKTLDYKLAIAERDKEVNEESREEIELNMAGVKLKQRAVEAPFSGFVADVYLEEGEDCSPGEPLFRLVNLYQCYFVCNIESRLAAYFEKNQMVDLNIEIGSRSVKRKGLIEFIAPTIDPASGLRKVKVLIDNSDFSLTPGATGTLNIEIEAVK